MAVASFDPRPRTEGDAGASPTARGSGMTVSIHAPALGATIASSRLRVDRPARFDPRPRTEGDCWTAQRRRLAMCVFRSTPPHGGRPPRPDTFRQLGQHVSIHAPARRATWRRWRSMRLTASCFDPRPRTGGDAGQRRQGSASNSVSIHAPARRATRPHSPSGHAAFRVSIHAPARRATLRLAGIAGTHVVHVSIHAPARRATSQSAPCSAFQVRGEVSIHAPARGATPLRAGTFRCPRNGGRRQRCLNRPKHCFDPRPRTEGDLGDADGQLRLGCRTFRSTPPHGGRRGPMGRAKRRESCFDPRPRTGGDKAVEHERDMTAGCFDPRPRTEGDGGLHQAICRRVTGCFDPRPRTGGDLQLGGPQHILPAVSIHAPARRATAYGGRRRHLARMFRSTPPHGGRPRDELPWTSWEAS